VSWANAKSLKDLHPEPRLPIGSDADFSRSVSFYFDSFARSRLLRRTRRPPSLLIGFQGQNEGNNVGALLGIKYDVGHGGMRRQQRHVERHC
jgi:hypothetical protein